MTLPQQMKENREKLIKFFNATPAYRSVQEWEKYQDEITTSTWHNVQEDMLERATAKILGYKTKDMAEYWGADRLKRAGYDIAIDDVVAALSSLRAGETPYYKRDHFHCWEQKVAACGLTKHTQCCLCEEPITSEPK